MRPEEPEELGFSAPAQRPAQQPRADNPQPQANRVPTESQMSNVSETGGHESASAPRRRTGHEEITDLAYEAADHTQDFAEEIEDAVRHSLSLLSASLLIHGVVLLVEKLREVMSALLTLPEVVEGPLEHPGCVVCLDIEGLRSLTV